LRSSRAVNNPDATNLMAILLASPNAPLPVEHAFMPPFARGHNDYELVAVANFVKGFFGNGLAKVTATDIDGRSQIPRAGTYIVGPRPNGYSWHSSQEEEPNGEEAMLYVVIALLHLALAIAYLGLAISH
jgi:hypothetical protein